MQSAQLSSAAEAVGLDQEVGACPCSSVEGGRNTLYTGDSGTWH